MKTGKVPSRARVVVGVDGSDDAGEALAVGIRLARALGAEVVAVFAYDGPATFTHQSLYGLRLAPAADGGRRLQLVHRFVNEWCRPLRESGIPHQTLVLGGSPGPAIAALAGRLDADFVVVGRRGLAPIAEMVLGSTGAYLTHHCETPVVVVSRPVASTGQEEPAVATATRQG